MDNYQLSTINYQLVNITKVIHGKTGFVKVENEA